MDQDLSDELATLRTALRSSVQAGAIAPGASDAQDSDSGSVQDNPAKIIIDSVSAATHSGGGGVDDLTRGIAKVATEIMAPGPAPVKRRGPGRPSKVPAAPQIKFVGIVNEPKFPDHRLELASANPQAFKKLFTFFEKLKAEEIHIHATPTELTFYTEDAKGELRVRAAVQGARINYYYCSAEPFWLSLNRAHVSRLFASIDKSFHKITIVYCYSDSMVLEFGLWDLLCAKENRFPVSVSIPVPKPNWLSLAKFDEERKDYTVAWTVNQRIFKKCHEIANQYAKVIKVELIGGSNLTLRYNGSGIPQFSEVYKNAEKIALESKLRPGEPFAIDYSALCGKTLSSATPAETVRIYCKSERPILFLSEEAGISVLTAMEPIVE